MLKLIYIFGHVLTVSNRCYGRCYIQKLTPLCTFLKFSTYLELNSARSIQNTFYKCSRALNLLFLKKLHFFSTSSFFGLLSHFNSVKLCHYSKPILSHGTLSLPPLSISHVSNSRPDMHAICTNPVGWSGMLVENLN